MISRKWIEPTFDVPTELHTKHFTLVPLGVDHVLKDFEAVISSYKQLKGMFGWHSTWPEGLTIRQNLIDLGWHEKEFQKKHSFAYATLSPDRRTYLGCVYINPPTQKEFDTDVYFWVRTSHAGKLTNIVKKNILRWLQDAWNFKHVNLPGKNIHIS